MVRADLELELELELVARWHLLDDAPRREHRQRLDCDDVEWACGLARALEQATVAVRYCRHSYRRHSSRRHSSRRHGNVAMGRTGRRTLARVLATDS